MSRTIHLIRHGQSTFNAHWEATGEDPLHFDARLSAIGEAQVAEARQLLKAERFDLVVTSPLTRAIQTALGIFGESRQVSGYAVEPLHREWVEQSCDVGRHPHELAADFAMLGFAHLEHRWWENGGEVDAIGVRIEPREDFIRRVESFRAWLSSRPEQRIAVVGHGNFFHALAGRQMRNCEIMEFKI